MCCWPCTCVKNQVNFNFCLKLFYCIFYTKQMAMINRINLMQSNTQFITLNLNHFLEQFRNVREGLFFVVHELQDN